MITTNPHIHTIVQEMSFLEEDDIIGIDNDIKLLLDKLLPNNCEERISAEERRNPRLFSVVAGMGGSGKTTLVRMLYNRLKARNQFDYCAWICVSQSFNRNDRKTRMLRELYKFTVGVPVTYQSERLDENEMQEEISRRLLKKRYLIVLDDVWDRCVWEDITCALPKNSNGSIVIITTSITSHVTASLRSDDIEAYVYQLRPLPPDCAMELFCKKAFGARKDSQHTASNCPQDLTELCHSLVESCEGLPLAIVALARMMSTKRTATEWRQIYRSIQWQLNNNPSLDRVKGILTLSYNELPFYLKPCFLYSSMFPEDFEISKRRLTKLWIAEGFIEARTGMTREEVAEEWLQQLISRHLLQAVKINHDGQVKAIRIHDVVRDLAIWIAKGEEFCFNVGKDHRAMRELGRCFRRTSIFASVDEEVGNSLGAADLQRLHSLLIFDKHTPQTCLFGMLSGLSLLRVLDLEGAYRIQELPPEIVALFYLRYLNLRDTTLERLPKSFHKLESLEFLDVRGTPMTVLPRSLSRMKALRHLYLSHFFVQNAKRVPVGVGKLRLLETLNAVVGDNRNIINDLGHLTNIRKFGIVDVKTEHMDRLSMSIQKMKNLYSLAIDSYGTIPIDLLFSCPPPQLRTLKLHGQLEITKLGSIGLLRNLSRLELHTSRLSDNPFPFLGSLRELKRLELCSDAYEGQGIRIQAEGFPQLVYLALRGLPNLQWVTLDSGAVPNLESLLIWGCENMKQAPQGVEHLTKLRDLQCPYLHHEFALPATPDQTTSTRT